MQVVYPKTDDQRQRLNDAVKNILLFKNVAPVSEKRAKKFNLNMP